MGTERDSREVVIVWRCFQCDNRKERRFRVHGDAAIDFSEAGVFKVIGDYREPHDQQPLRGQSFMIEHQHDCDNGYRGILRLVGWEGLNR